jgi:DNA-binding transcriptional LysR family regulator
MLDPRRLLTFREVAHQRSFSRAAEALSLTQPAVSQQVRALETQLGERLIERGRGAFTLTPAGELLAAHADAILERLQLAEAQLGETIAGARARLRLGAFPSVLATIVPAAIERVQSSLPDLELSVTEGSTAELATAVRDGRLHAALCFQNAADPPREHAGTRRHDLLEEPMVALVGPRHRLSERKRIRLTELANDPWTAATPDGLIYRACAAAGFEPHIAYLTADPLAIRALVAAGLAVTLTPRLLAPQLAGVSTCPLAGERPRRVIYALTPPAGIHPLVVPFLEALRAVAATSAARPAADASGPARAFSSGG